MTGADPIESYRNLVAYEMFLDTADLNYVGARSAYFEQRDWDFWWLTLHALEKYLKTVLLVNGRSAREGGHEIPRLLGQLSMIDSRLAPPPLVRPRVSGLDNWTASSIETFIKRLNAYGSPSNRYGQYGYSLTTDDLLKADQLIYWVRRHARPLTTHKIDWIAELAKSPTLWLLGRGPLEKVAARSAHDRGRRSLVELNAAFFPNRRHRAITWRHSATSSPIRAWADRLVESANGSAERARAREVVQWIVENIYLARGLSDKLNGILDQYP
jgi:hypothetical protein